MARHCAAAAVSHRGGGDADWNCIEAGHRPARFRVKCALSLVLLGPEPARTKLEPTTAHELRRKAGSSTRRFQGQRMLLRRQPQQRQQPLLANQNLPMAQEGEPEPAAAWEDHEDRLHSGQLASL